MVSYDEQLRGYFDETDMESLRTHQTEFLSMVMGGPVDYSGKEMREAHAELDILQTDFVVLVDYLERALIQNGVSPPTSSMWKNTSSSESSVEMKP